MSCGERKTIWPDDKLYQDSSFFDGKSISKKNLENVLSAFDGENIRIYTIKTTRMIGGKILNGGTAPNVEGGIVTLCTCKHDMRKNISAKNWQGAWVLGLSSRNPANGFRDRRHYVAYMMRVEKAFSSHMDLYDYLRSNYPKVAKLKDASFNPLGDLFAPLPDAKNPLDYASYNKPHVNHDHRDSWHKDIEVGPLLLGDPNNTYVWNEPKIIFDIKLNMSRYGVPKKIGQELYDLFIDKN